MVTSKRPYRGGYIAAAVSKRVQQSLCSETCAAEGRSPRLLRVLHQRSSRGPSRVPAAAQAAMPAVYQPAT